MAIDLMVMPISRYLAGNFITPQMALSWWTGVPYRVVQPRRGGMREFPPNQPFSGPDAATKRPSAIQLVIDTIAPVFGGKLPWDEASEAEPQFERVDAGSLDAMHGHVTKMTRGSRLERWLRRPLDPGLAHLMGTFFVPAELRGAVQISGEFEGVMTSGLEALRQLDRPFPEAAAAACASLRKALTAGRELHVPVIVDA